MENTVLSGLLKPLQALVPERREPPVKYEYIQPQINTQITADHIQHIRIAAMAVEKHQLLKTACANCCGNIMEQGIIGLGPESNRSCKAHVFIALSHIQLRCKNQVSCLKFAFIYHLVHQRGKNNGIRAYRQMRSVLLCRRSGQKDNGLILVQGCDFISCHVLPFFNHTSSILLPGAACFINLLFLNRNIKLHPKYNRNRYSHRIGRYK